MHIKKQLVTLCFIIFCIPGCAYIKDRALDFTDIVDFRAGWTFGIVGAKVEVTDYLGAGLGLGFIGMGYESYGRWLVEPNGCIFAHIIVIGTEDTGIDNFKRNATICLFGGNYRLERPPLIDQFRIGAEAFIPGIHLGIYFNSGQFYDFFVGLASFDPADDDGLPKYIKVYLQTLDDSDDLKMLIDKIREAESKPESESKTETESEISS